MGKSKNVKKLPSTIPPSTLRKINMERESLKRRGRTITVHEHERLVTPRLIYSSRICLALDKINSTCRLANEYRRMADTENLPSDVVSQARKIKFLIEDVFKV